MTDIAWMIAPIAACLVALAALGWFGLHVLQRGILFVDLALAQFAALGATWAVLVGLPPDSPRGLLLSLVFTGVGAAFFTVARHFEHKVPSEAIIGIAYAVGAALAVLLLDLADDPHGAEKIEHLLVGNIVWVRWSEIAVATVAVTAVGAVHAIWRKRFLALSFEGDVSPAWDLLFYLSFGVVVTAVVGTIGVLLVFSLLIIPAVVARLFADGIGARLLIGYAVGAVACIGGVAISYEHSTGPIVVAILGAIVVVALAFVGIREKPSRAAWVVGGTAVCSLAVWAASSLGVTSDGHEGHEHHLEEASHQAVHEDLDPLSRLEAAQAEVEAGEVHGLLELAHLTQEDAPFIRMEAHDALVAAGGDVDYDPLAGPDTEGLWLSWASGDEAASSLRRHLDSRGPGSPPAE